jgi:hypothetical protein
MREIGPTSNDEMVLSFIRAEIDSPVWGPSYEEVLGALHADRSTLIDNGDLNDGSANHVRGAVLGMVRGYGRNGFLFSGFPLDTTWRRVLLDHADFQTLKYVNSGPWKDLFTTRSVEDGARNYQRDAGLAARVDDSVQKINRGDSIAEIILVEDADRLVVLEGNTRATAYLKIATTPIPALIGSSPAMHQWDFI